MGQIDCGKALDVLHTAHKEQKSDFPISTLILLAWRQPASQISERLMKAYMSFIYLQALKKSLVTIFAHETIFDGCSSAW